jgi:hypothetical protein
MVADGYDVRVESDEDGEPFALFIRGKGRRVDVLLAETEYQHEALDRATTDVITVEDVIIHKLRTAGRSCCGPSTDRAPERYE